MALYACKHWQSWCSDVTMDGLPALWASHHVIRLLLRLVVMLGNVLSSGCPLCSAPRLWDQYKLHFLTRCEENGTACLLSIMKDPCGTLSLCAMYWKHGLDVTRYLLCCA